MFNLTESTVKVRHKLVMVTCKALAPRLALHLSEYTRRVGDNYETRPFTKFLKNHYGNKPLVGCEIGYGHGYNASNILQNLNMKELYCIEADFNGKWKNDLGDTVIGKENVHLLKMESSCAFDGGFLPNWCDFIYIDGDHSYRQCKEDLEKAVLHVKKEGYIGGHDFNNLTFPGVVKAVVEKAVEKKATLIAQYQDWWFPKADIA